MKCSTHLSLSTRSTLLALLALLTLPLLLQFSCSEEMSDDRRIFRGEAIRRANTQGANAEANSTSTESSANKKASSNSEENSDNVNSSEGSTSKEETTTSNPKVTVGSNIATDSLSSILGKTLPTHKANKGNGYRMGTGYGTKPAIIVATDGSDSNSGSLDSPLKTIKAAVKIVQDGGTIELRAGTYAGVTISPKYAGNKDAWITLKPYKDEKAIIDGNLTGKNETVLFYMGDDNYYGNLDRDGKITLDSAGDPKDRSSHADGDAGEFNTPMYWRVENLEIKGGANYVIQLENSFVEIVGNDLHGSENDIIKTVFTADHVLIAKNKIHDVDAAWPTSSSNAPNAQGIDSVGNTDTRIVENHIYNIPSAGISTKGNGRFNVFENNLLENIYGEALRVGQGTDRHRLRYSDYEAYDCLVRNNIVIKAYESCIAVSAAYNIKVVHNTCIDAAKERHGAIHLSNQSEVSDQTRTYSHDIDIMNNIIISASGKRVAKMDWKFIDSSKPISDAKINVNFNIYYSGGSTKVFENKEYTGEGGDTFTKWQNKGLDQDSFLEDPLVDITGKTYKPMVGSKALDAGTQLYSFAPSDFNFGERSNSRTPDMGAIEVP